MVCTLLAPLSNVPLTYLAVGAQQCVQQDILPGLPLSVTADRPDNDKLQRVAGSNQQQIHCVIDPHFPHWSTFAAQQRQEHGVFAMWAHAVNSEAVVVGLHTAPFSVSLCAYNGDLNRALERWDGRSEKNPKQNNAQ